jgi:hypothetical protein
MTTHSSQNEIPLITDPMGRSWEQPSRDRILIDDQYALMEYNTFESLLEYNASIPTGVYEGKMWKCAGREGKWWLRWYGPYADPNKCSIEQREIFLV